MAKKTPGWLLGCLIGCGALLLGAVLLLAAGAFWVRGITHGFDEAVAARDALEGQYGKPGDFTPPPDGSIPAPRMEAFLEVCEALAPQRREIAAVFAKMPLSREAAEELDKKPWFEKLTTVLDISGSAMGLAGSLGEFFRLRDESLLAAGMGMGEYTYIYTLSYYSFLGHTPSEGPEGAHPPGSGGSGVRVEMTGPGLRSRIHKDFLSMLENQEAALPPGTPEATRRALRAEMEAMEQDRDRYPWKDGLPGPIRASLEPWRAKLEESWEPATNMLELAVNKKSGKYSFTAE